MSEMETITMTFPEWFVILIAVLLTVDGTLKIIRMVVDHRLKRARLRLDEMKAEASLPKSGK